MSIREINHKNTTKKYQIYVKITSSYKKNRRRNFEIIYYNKESNAITKVMRYINEVSMFL